MCVCVNFNEIQLWPELTVTMVTGCMAVFFYLFFWSSLSTAISLKVKPDEEGHHTGLCLSALYHRVERTEYRPTTIEHGAKTIEHTTEKMECIPYII